MGEKIGMTQLFDAKRNAVPVTIISVSKNVVLSVRSKEKDGYAAVQVGCGARKQKNINKPLRGHYGALGNFQYVREFRIRELPAPSSQLPARGDEIDISVFQEGDLVKVSGISKGKGFQGVVKRHGFHGAPKTHGTKHAHREPGSIGGAGGRAGGRVAKGMRMAGRMGGDRVSVRNLKIAKVDPEKNILAVRGAVPGRRGTLVEIMSS
ncbi:MAG: large subunit ribosomal protein L3 [Parcubacteria group bacterium Gr01-1014_66]|nr:MAG: large subunit ribosomal protein L3 [Parcubacteria group bacterium Gr01-1014_66]